MSYRTKNVIMTIVVIVYMLTALIWGQVSIDTFRHYGYYVMTGGLVSVMLLLIVVDVFTGRK